MQTITFHRSREHEIPGYGGKINAAESGKRNIADMSDAVRSLSINLIYPIKQKKYLLLPLVLRFSLYPE